MLGTNQKIKVMKNELMNLIALVLIFTLGKGNFHNYVELLFQPLKPFLIPLEPIISTSSKQGNVVPL
jgi:hypothetical protein